MGRRSQWALLLLMVGALIGGLVVLRADSTSHSDEGANLIVHEWGTFTSFSGANGVPVPFYASDEDLPGFVYRSPRMKNNAPALVSMETPILYFYAERALTASVDVVFPRGRVTEWYPATIPSASNWLRYEKLRILPGATVDLPTEPGPDRYYAARATDAAPIQVETTAPTAHTSMLPSSLSCLAISSADPVSKRTEHEKFIFYRGVGNIAMPLALSAQGNGKVVIKNTGTEELRGCVLVHVKTGEIRYRVIGPLAGGTEATVEIPEAETGLVRVNAGEIRSCAIDPLASGSEATVEIPGNLPLSKGHLQEGKSVADRHGPVADAGGVVRERGPGDGQDLGGGLVR